NETVRGTTEREYNDRKHEREYRVPEKDEVIAIEDVCRRAATPHKTRSRQARTPRRDDVLHSLFYRKTLARRRITLYCLEPRRQRRRHDRGRDYEKQEVPNPHRSPRYSIDRQSCL